MQVYHRSNGDELHVSMFVEYGGKDVCNEVDTLVIVSKMSQKYVTNFCSILRSLYVEQWDLPFVPTNDRQRRRARLADPP